MSAGTFSAVQKYIDGLGGPRFDAKEPSFSIPEPKVAAKGIRKDLQVFADMVVTATNDTFSGSVLAAAAAGARDGAIAVPGRRRSQDGRPLVRPPQVDKSVQLAASAMSKARAIADIRRAGFELDESVARTSAKANVGKRRRLLHRFQLGQPALLLVLATSAFTAIAARLNEWPNSSSDLTGSSDATPTVTSPWYIAVATFLIVAMGITVGFFHATRERSMVLARRSPKREDILEGAAAAPVDRVVSQAYSLGFALSMVIAALVGVGGYFRLATVSLGRMALGVAVWIVWGAAAYFGSALMTRLSQHWLNLLPPEIDLTEADEEAGSQNAVSAGVGRRYVEFVLRSQHAFAVDAGTLLVEQYYESNLLTRMASRDEDLDAFIREDILQARKDLQAVAHEFQRKGIDEPPLPAPAGH